MNCLHACKEDLIGYSPFRSASGEIISPDLSRRGFVAAAISGIAAIPLLRLMEDWQTTGRRPLSARRGHCPKPIFSTDASNAASAPAFARPT